MNNLKDKVMIQKPNTLANVLGEIELATDDNWQDVQEVCAEVKPFTANEIARGQAYLDTSHKVTIRYFVGLDTTHRLVWVTRHKTHTLDIAGIIDREGRGIWMDCACREATEA